MNLGSMGQDNVERFGEYQSSYFEGNWYTNVEMEHESNRLGNALKSVGIERGDRVAIQMPNSPVVLWSFPAVYKIGAIAVPMNPLLRPDQAAYIFQNSGAKAVITSPDFAPWVQAAQKQAPEMKHIIVTEKDDIPGTTGYDKFVENREDSLAIEEMDNDDIAALIYTAGTTGPNKGVMHTHLSLYLTAMGYADFVTRHLSTSLQINSRQMDVRAHKLVQSQTSVSSFDLGRSLFVLPLSHSFGLAVALTGILFGSKSIIMKWFDPSLAMKYIEEFRITNFSGVPAMYIMMLNHPDIDKYDLSSLETCACGAAPLPPEVGKQWRAKTGTDIYEGWGMTETGATTCGNMPSRPPKYGSIGVCMIKPDTMKIFDDNDNALPPGQTGELVVKGPTIMKGYWNMPEETEKALKNGWLHTGDVGYMDDDGYFYITDRKKDIIIRGGENVSPREVEEVLLEIPQIADAGVIGVPDITYGEEIKAFCVLHKDEMINGTEIITYCKQKLPSFKVPKSVQIVDTLPKNMLGKLLRAELRKLAKQ
ncbi:MAG: AMP-binding protein, partial [Dehalococcoidia bacterium]|nr:AMP-binding protein [Dehalococcoidia bacterium]